MTTRSSAPRLIDGSQSLTIMGRPLVYQQGLLPVDFAQRLRRLKAITGLSWNELGDVLGVDPKQLQRWMEGIEPCGGAMLSIVGLSGQVPGGIDIIMGEGFLSSLWRP